MNLLNSIKLFFIRTIYLMFFLSSRPEEEDHRHSLLRRLRGKKLAIMNIGPGGVKIGCARIQNKKFVIEDVKYLNISTINDEVIKELRSRTDCDSIAFCVNSNTTMCSIRDMHVKLSELQNKLLNSPQVVIGADYEPDRIYQFLPHPANENGICLSIQSEEIKRIESALTTSGFKIMRSSIGTFNLLNYILASKQFFGIQPPPTASVKIAITLDQTLATAVFVHDQTWGSGHIMSHRSIVPGVVNKSQDLYEIQEKIVSFFNELADNARRYLLRDIDFPVEFIILNSQTPQDAFGRITSFFDTDSSIKIVTLDTGELKDIDLQVLIYDPI